MLVTEAALGIGAFPGNRELEFQRVHPAGDAPHARSIRFRLALGDRLVNSDEPPTKLADIATGSAWGLWGLSLAQLNQLLQMIALVLTITATAITIGVHINRWRKK